MTLKRRNKRRYIVLSYDEKKIERYYYNLKKINNHNSSYFNNHFEKSMSEKSQKRMYNFDNNNNHNNNSIDINNKNFNLYYYSIIKIIKKRYSEIFGFIDSEKADIHVIVIKKILLPKNITVLRCNLDSIDKLLFIISVSHPEITTLKISGTIKKLISYNLY